MQEQGRFQWTEQRRGRDQLVQEHHLGVNSLIPVVISMLSKFIFYQLDKLIGVASIHDVENRIVDIKNLETRRIVGRHCKIHSL